VTDPDHVHGGDSSIPSDHAASQHTLIGSILVCNKPGSPRPLAPGNCEAYCGSGNFASPFGSAVAQQSAATPPLFTEEYDPIAGRYAFLFTPDCLADSEEYKALAASNEISCSWSATPGTNVPTCDGEDSALLWSCQGCMSPRHLLVAWLLEWWGNSAHHVQTRSSGDQFTPEESKAARETVENVHALLNSVSEKLYTAGNTRRGSLEMGSAWLTQAITVHVTKFGMADNSVDAPCVISDGEDDIFTT